MKKLIQLTYIYLFILAACKPHLKDFSPSPGDANFSHYVAIGNSLTAGYSDGALYKSGQESGYANLLAQQFQTVGGGGFKIPLMADDLGVGFDGTTPVTKFVLRTKSDCLGNISPSPVRAGTPSLLNLAYIGGQGPYNNLGVPGAKSFHLLAPQFGSPLGGNPFYTRFASNPGTSTVLTDALAQNPTFFTYWIGSNDALLYALDGGEEGTDSITSYALFDGAVSNELAALTGTNAKGAIANIPDITAIPFFTTVPYNGLVLTDPAAVTALNANYSGLGITFHLGQNAFIITDSAAPGFRRQIHSDEYILLTVPQDSLKCKQWGSVKPIPGKYVLDAQETSAVNSAILHYNQSIFNFSTQYGLAFVDVNQTIKQLKSGLTFQGVTLTTQFVSGGAFSLDGIHLSPRGNAVVANQFIQSINSKFNAMIPLVDVSAYQGVQFP
jgi:lysophospholipase L1-like esterase